MSPTSYDEDELRRADRDAQLTTMEAWFRERFESPAERTPFDSEEGGYVWIWGGPYDAREELQYEFDGVVVNEIIDELAGALEDENLEWAPTERPGDYDEGLFDAVSANSAERKTLNDALETISALLKVEVPQTSVGAYRRLLFANAITALETYLSDTFINRVFGDPGLVQAYIDSEPKFRDRKVQYKDVLREADKVTAEARKELLDVVWHNIAKVRAMYRHVLGADFGDVSSIASAIQIRHDIVHRNGRQKDGSIVAVEAGEVAALVNDIQELAFRIELKIDLGINSSPIDLGRA